MPINRFDRPGQYDWTMEHYVPQEWTPNLDAWDKLLGTLQQERDMASALSEKMPAYITQDTQAAKKYAQDMRSQVDKITDLYTGSDLDSARAAQADMVRQIKRDWSPGGTAYGLESRKAQYDKLVGDYKKKFKEDPGYMMDYAKTAIDAGISSNEVQQAIGDPNIGAYINIGAELDKAMQGFKSDKGTVIRGLNGKWIYKETTEEVREDDLRKFSNNILSQPRFRQQLGIDVWRSGQGQTEEGLRQQFEDKLQADLAQRSESLANMDTRQFQQMALEQGYDIGSSQPDGIEGPKTKAARAAMQKKLAEGAEASKRDFNAQGFLASQVVEGFVEPLVEKHGFKKVTRDVKHNPYWLQAMKESAKNARMDLLTQRPRPTTSIAFYGPAQSIDMTNVEKSKDEALKNRGEAVAALNENLAPLGGVLNVTNAASALKALRESFDGTQHDIDKFKSLYKGRDPDSVFNYLIQPRNAESAQMHLDGINEIDENLDQLQSVEASLDVDFNNSNKGQSFWKQMYTDNIKNPSFRNLMEREGINSPEELAVLVQDGLKDGTRDISTLTWLTSAPPTMREKLVEKYRNKRNTDYEQNPEDYKSLSPMGLTGMKGSVMDEANSLATKMYQDTGGLGFIGVDGERIVFRDVSNTNKKYGSSDLDIKSAKVQAVLDGNKQYYMITGTVGTGENKRTVYAYADAQHAAANQSMGQKGLELAASTFDTKGKPINDIASENERRIGSLMYFQNAYSDQIDMSLAKRIAPNEDYSYKPNNVAVTSQGIVIDNAQVRLGDVTPVESITLNETGGEIDVVVAADSDNRKIYHIIQYDPQSQREVVMLNENNRPEAYTSVESALEEVATMAAEVNVKYNGLYREFSKTKKRFTPESLGVLQTIEGDE